MNAKWMRRICVSACLPLWFASLAPPSYGSPLLELLLSTATLGQLAADEPLGRDGVDVLLRQARAAIQQGHLDQAEAILRRTERAAVHYPFLHMGPTPASVRRELQKAQRSAPPAKRASGAQPVDRPTAGPAAQGLPASHAAVVDPFLRRDAALPAGPPPPLPSDIPRGYQAAPDSDDWETDGRLPAVERPIANPFTPSNVSGTVISDGDYGLLLPGESGGTSRPWSLPAAPLPSGAAANESLPPGTTAKQQALELLTAARQALDAGDVPLAERMAREAGALAVPESQFLPHEDRPSLLAWEILQAKNAARDLRPAASERHADVPRYSAEPAYVYVDDDAAADEAASGEPWHAQPRLALVPDPLQMPAASASGPETSSGIRAAAPSALDPAAIIARAEAALRDSDRETALELFSQAYLLREGLDGPARRQVEERLYMLSTGDGHADAAGRPAAPAGQTAPPADSRLAAAPSSERLSPAGGTARELGATASLLDAAGEGEQMLARQLSAEVGKLQSDVRRLREKEPQKALEMLRETRQRVEDAKLTGDLRDHLLRRLDLTIRDTERYYHDNRHQIELDQQNAAVMADVERSREVKLKVQQKIADLVNQYNRLKDEQRFAEAQVVAQQLRDLAPDEQVTQQIWLDAKFVRRTVMNRHLVDAKESSFWEQLNAVEESAVNQVARDGEELRFDQKYWEAFAKGRKSPDNNRRNERELEIERRLRTPVQLKYIDTPLSEVIEGLSTLSGVNIHLDPRGLSQEGIHSDTTVTINLNQEISLKSALNLVLEPLHLSYLIKDEVLKITSEQLRDGELVTVTYNVADLVIPIPNFVPNNNIGLQGLINDAYSSMSPGAFGGSAPAVMVGQRGAQRGGAAGNHNVLAQRFNAAPGGPMGNSTVPIGSGPGGMGGGANADFDSLIDLIVSTVSSESWAENGGGEAEIRPFPTNLSLVISQTQAVHEEIADLLAQLRRLVDLQVTIEVRFIRLNDSFFERIGIDFQMNVVDRGFIGATPVRGGVDVPGVPVQSGTVGLQRPAFPDPLFPNFTADLDIPFRQGHFAATAPAFGGFDPANAATFGFAILSDIEAFFLIEAAQGDRRTNVLNAPKVTLFNGQQAFVADAVSRPFVIGVIPVVGEFAAAQQPVIVVLNEGTMMTIQAVVSDDRRYVRLTVVPFFTQVGEVREFTFEGSTSSTSSSSSTRDDDDDTKSESQNEGVTRSGVTVQLPAFQFVSVVTTVSVPDGGTVLLGGIKRLSEGRNEVGVPLLSKIPYINRLFKNVGIGRETDSLMMMVTPRIIIQEEEEERLGIVVP